MVIICFYLIIFRISCKDSYSFHFHEFDIFYTIEYQKSFNFKIVLARGLQACSDDEEWDSSWSRTPSCLQVLDHRLAEYRFKFWHVDIRYMDLLPFFRHYTGFFQKILFLPLRCSISFYKMKNGDYEIPQESLLYTKSSIEPFIYIYSIVGSLTNYF